MFTAMFERLHKSPISADFSPDFDLICLERPYSCHWSLSGQKHFFHDLNFERRFRRDEGMGCIMVGWHIVEAFEKPPSLWHNI